MANFSVLYHSTKRRRTQYRSAPFLPAPGSFITHPKPPEQNAAARDFPRSFSIRSRSPHAPLLRKAARRQCSPFRFLLYCFIGALPGLVINADAPGFDTLRALGRLRRPSPEPLHSHECRSKQKNNPLGWFFVWQYVSF